MLNPRSLAPVLMIVASLFAGVAQAAPASHSTHVASVAAAKVKTAGHGKRGHAPKHGKHHHRKHHKKGSK
jgi:hypothetical protein